MKSYGMAIQMKPTEQYFPKVLLKMLYKIALFLWMKSYGVTIQMKPLQKHFCKVTFISRLLQNEIYFCFFSVLFTNLHLRFRLWLCPVPVTGLS